MAGVESLNIKTPLQEKKNERQGRKQHKMDKAQNWQGGALTVTKPLDTQKGGSSRSVFPRWLGPSVDAEKKDAQSNRKEPQVVATIEQPVETNDANTTETSAGPDLTKLWWVNVWTQQLPDRPEPILNHINTEELENRTVIHDDHGLKLKELSESRNDDSRVRSTRDQQICEIAPKNQAKKEDNSSGVKNATALNATVNAAVEKEPEGIPTYVSTGYWATIDGLASLGLSGVLPAFRISRPLRPLRKVLAHVTGLHGALSGKPRKTFKETAVEEDQLDEDDLAMVRRRIAAIDKALEGVERVSKSDELEVVKRKSRWLGRSDPVEVPEVRKIATVTAEMMIPSIRKSPEVLEEERREKRVKEIDRLMSEAQVCLAQLACEKDELQRRPNPLWNYTTEKVSKRGNQRTITTRRFSFPPDYLVEEYLDFLLSSGRLVKMNHTNLWQNDRNEEDDDEVIGDDLINEEKSAGNNGNGGGNWILRQSLGKGSTLGEKIGEAAEEAAYKAIAKSVMGGLSRVISASHGVNIMKHTDIRLSMEATPDLPPMSKHGIIPGGIKTNYARDALQGVMRRGARRIRGKRYRYELSDDEFVQREAVVETLLSHCQISAPLLKLFPLAWQRAMLGNIITLVTAVVADFCEGIQFEILGHRLGFSFRPVTEIDMISHIAMAEPSRNRPSLRSEQFEAAVHETANDLSENLKFLDRWHERALGGGILRSQIANLIARLVLTLAGEVLSGAQMDLWASQAGGPRMVAGLEFRTRPTYMENLGKQ